MNTVLNYFMVVWCPEINKEENSNQIDPEMVTHSEPRMAPKQRQTKQVLIILIFFKFLSINPSN